MKITTKDKLNIYEIKPINKNKLKIESSPYKLNTNYDRSMISNYLDDDLTM